MRPSSLTEAEDRDAETVDDDGERRRPTDRRPGGADPYDHAALLEIGLGHTTAATSLPMRIRVDAPVADHGLVRARFGIPGLILDGTATTPKDRAFRPGNLTLGGFYRFGTRGRVGAERRRLAFTVGAGGSVTLPVAQFDRGDPTATVAASQASILTHAGEYFLDFEHETWGITPGGYFRLAYGPLFVSASADFSLAFATDDRDASHGLALRLEAGYRGGDTMRLGLGFTEVLRMGGDTDYGQAALRLFARFDFRAVTLGTEFVMALDAPAGFAFDSGKSWGLLTAVGISL